MTAKEKAKELIDKFSERTKFFDEYAGWLIHLESSKAKGHALIAVAEILNVISTGTDYAEIDLYNFWEEVKKEIEKL